MTKFSEELTICSINSDILLHLLWSLFDLEMTIVSIVRLILIVQCVKRGFIKWQEDGHPTYDMYSHSLMKRVKNM